MRLFLGDSPAEAEAVWLGPPACEVGGCQWWKKMPGLACDSCCAEEA